MVLFSSLMCHLIAPVLFYLHSWNIPVVDYFSDHFLILLVISALFSVIIFFTKGQITLVVMLSLKFFIIFLIGYPLEVI